MKFTLSIATALRAGRRFASARDVSAGIADVFGPLAQETFAIITLSAKNTLLRGHVVSVGTLTGSLVHPREVFGPAIADHASSIVLIHNHPSGDPTPSREDIDVTERLVKCGSILGIRIIDHVIIGADGRFHSFADSGTIPLG